jgi:hypothetical protein
LHAERIGAHGAAGLCLFENEITDSKSLKPGRVNSVLPRPKLSKGRISGTSRGYDTQGLHHNKESSRPGSRKQH